MSELTWRSEPLWRDEDGDEKGDEKMGKSKKDWICLDEQIELKMTGAQKHGLEIVLKSGNYESDGDYIREALDEKLRRDGVSFLETGLWSKKSEEDGMIEDRGGEFFDDAGGSCKDGGGEDVSLEDVVDQLGKMWVCVRELERKVEMDRLDCCDGQKQTDEEIEKIRDEVFELKNYEMRKREMVVESESDLSVGFFTRGGKNVGDVGVMRGVVVNTAGFGTNLIKEYDVPEGDVRFGDVRFVEVRGCPKRSPLVGNVGGWLSVHYLLKRCGYWFDSVKKVSEEDNLWEWRFECQSEGVYWGSSLHAEDLSLRMWCLSVVKELLSDMGFSMYQDSGVVRFREHRQDSDGETQSVNEKGGDDGLGE